MPITNLPTFVEKQLLTAAQLNQIVTALQTKFAGNIAGSDLVWPLVTDGDIDFGGANTLLNLPTLWNVVNAAEYDTFTDAVSALPSAGGAIYIPPGTTVTTDGINMTGRNICIYGEGHASILRLTASASSGYMLRHGGDGTYRFQMYNLMVDGQSTGSAQDGIQLRQPLSAMFSNVTFKNFSGRALWITNSGTPGEWADNVQISQCLFVGGTLNQIEANDVIMLSISNCQFDNGTASGIYVKPTTSSYYAKHIKITDNSFLSCVDSIIVHGSGTALNAQWSFIDILSNVIAADTGTGITAGTATDTVTKCNIRGNTVDSPGVNGIDVSSKYGVVADNMVYEAAVNGIDLLDSDNLSVSGNLARKTGAYGIDTGTANECTIHGNDVSNCTTEGVGTADTAGVNVIYGNVGTQLGPIIGGYSIDVAYSGGDGAWSSADSFIPANTLNAIGDSISITLQIADAGGVTSSRANIVLDDGSAHDMGGINVDIGQYGIGHAFIVRDAGGTTSYTKGANNDADRVLGEAIDWTTDVAIELTIFSANGDCTIENMQVIVISGSNGGPTS